MTDPLASLTPPASPPDLDQLQADAHDALSRYADALIDADIVSGMPPEQVAVIRALWDGILKMLEPKV